MEEIMKHLSLISLISLAGVLSTANAEVDPGKILHDDANCMKCHAKLGYNQPDTTKMSIESYSDLKKAVQFCDSNLNVGWFDDELDSVVDYLNKTYYKLPN